MFRRYKTNFLILAIVGIVGGDSDMTCGGRGFCQEREDCYGEIREGSCSTPFVCCESSGMSDKKCEENGQFVFKEEVNEALTARAMFHTASECNIDATPLVVGGSKAKPKEFPHMAVIGSGVDIKKAQWTCGGSLITENYVLTAAHCGVNDDGDPMKFVRLGATNLNDPTRQDFEIAEIIKYPKFVDPIRYYDIALIKLSKPAEINEYVRPACLHSTFDEHKYEKAIATGWGKLDYYSKEGSQNLMKVILSLIESSQCNSTFSSDVEDKVLKNGIIPSQLCAGELKGGKDTCHGDSGGPLQIVRDKPYCMYSIIGVTSFGKFCGFKNSPAVYTRVAYYVPWIESIIWGKK